MCDVTMNSNPQVDLLYKFQGNAKRLSVKPSGSKQLPAKQTGISGTRSKSNSLSSTVASLAMSTASDSAVVLKRPTTVLPQPSRGLKQDVKQKAKAEPVPKTSGNPTRSLVRRATEKSQVAEKVKPAARRPSVASVGSSGKLLNPTEKNIGQSGPAKGTDSSLKPPLHRNVMGASKEAGTARNGLVKTSKK